MDDSTKAPLTLFVSPILGRTEKPDLDAMAERARKRFCERFTDVIMADSYRSLFERVS